MGRKRILERLYLYHFVIVSASFAALAWFVSRSYREWSGDGAQSIPPDALALLSSFHGALFLAWASITVIFACMAFLESRQISRQLEALKSGVAGFARGDPNRKLIVSDIREVGSLAETLNFVFTQLAEQLGELQKKNLEQTAILDTMSEGVLAVDPEERIFLANPSAARLLGFKLDEARGQRFGDVASHPELRRFVTGVLKGEVPVEEAIVLQRGQERFLQAHGTLLHNRVGKLTGLLIVVNDMTQIWEHENVRKDFVSNVSHELKTPITSIKGAVETLLGGAVENKKDADHFLKMTLRHADRLNQIIEDLLSISRIERDRLGQEINLEPNPLKDVLAHALQVCGQKAGEKKITLVPHCPDRVMAVISPPLLEQALVNLIDNAVKYSEPRAEVAVEVTETETELVIRVRDRGCGIEKKYLPQLFSRFFRVDKARSRKLGGTGLGLAIVKLIIQVHGGRVSVESTPGKGSTFSLHLPRGSGGGLRQRREKIVSRDDHEQ